MKKKGYELKEYAFRILKEKIFNSDDLEVKYVTIKIQDLPNSIFDYDNGNHILNFNYFSKDLNPFKKIENIEEIEQITIAKKMDPTNISWSKYEKIIYELLRIDYFENNSRYLNKEYLKVLYDCAYEKGICQSVVGNNVLCGNVLYSLISELKKWSQRTYEGRRIPFGFILDCNPAKSTKSVSYPVFLKNNFSAMLTDGEFSAIQLDSNGNFLKYLSVGESKNQDDLVSKIDFSPLKYQKFTSYCYNNNIGVILNENGTILFMKKKEICFAYRNGNWVYYDHNIFCDSIYRHLYSNCTNKKMKKDYSLLLKSIYSSVLDMIFSGEGCCISIIRKDKEKNFRKKNYEPLSAKNAKSDISQKKLFIRECIRKPSGIGNSRFSGLSRKLRQELLSYDGAIVLKENGAFEAIGEIVKVENQSSDGGGRTKAAQALATGGIGIKVSEDGFIQCYGDKKGKPYYKLLFEIK